MSRRWSIIPFIYLLQNALLGFLDPCVTYSDCLADLSGAKEKRRKRQLQFARDSRKQAVICCLVITLPLRGLLKQAWTLPHIL